MTNQSNDAGPALMQMVPLSRRAVLLAIATAVAKAKIKPADASTWTQVTIEHVDDGALD
jgi:hypothetical protein